MQFANPIWLVGLTGLLIPIGIHLLSRKESNVIKIGSLRYLEESNTKQSVSLRLNEMLLLIVRCLLITIVVLLLSGLYWDRTSKENWLLIEKGLETDKDFSSLIDSLQQKGFKPRRLARQFPDLRSNTPNDPPNYWQLVEDLHNHSLDNAVVLSYNYAAGFRGKRIALPQYVTWISKDPTPSDFTLSAVRVSPDSMVIRTGYTRASETHFQSFVVRTPLESVYDSVPITTADTINVAIAFDPEFSYDKNIMEASFRSIDDNTPASFAISTTSPDKWDAGVKQDWLIWLSDKPIPDSPGEIKKIWSTKSKNDNRPLLKPETKGWSVTRALTEEIALREKLPLQLSTILLPHKELDARLTGLNKRVMPDEKVWSNANQVGHGVATASFTDDVSKWLAVLLLLLLVTERTLAYKRNQ